MKRMIFGGLAVAALAVNGFVFANKQSAESELTEAQLENIDALSDGEGFIMICGAKEGTCWKWNSAKRDCAFSGYLKDYCIRM